MKKSLALIIALVLALALAACGESKEDVRGNVTPAPTDTTEPTEDTPAPAEDEDFDLGTRSGNVYENKFIGIGFELGEEWTFYTDEQMAELNNISIENAANDKVKEMLKASNIVRDAFATSEDGSTVQVILEKASGAALLLDADGYVDVSMSNGSIDAAVEQLEESGLTDITTEKSTVTVSGKEFPCIVLNAKVNDISYQQKTIIIKKGSYFVNVAVSALGGTDDIIAKIYTL